MRPCEMPCFLVIAFLLAVTQADVSRTRRNDDTIIVTTIEEEPYLTVKDTGSGNDRFTGFIPQLMEKISKEKNIKYELRLVDDKKYGFPENGNWNGMVGELIRGTAHLAAAPLTISDQRKQVIQFTEPFMALGTTMLVKKPTSGDPPVNSFEELGKQTAVGYGVVKDGFTMSFFKNSHEQKYQKIWQYLNSHRDTSMLSGNTKGVEKVRKSDGKFIFIMENSTASFWMHQEPCDLLVVGEPISRRDYGFATSKSQSALNDKVSDAIRKLKQNGELAKLETHWWRKDAQCESGATSLTFGLIALPLGALSLILTRY